jgi:hypothetical protein
MDLRCGDFNAPHRFPGLGNIPLGSHLVTVPSGRVLSDQANVSGPRGGEGGYAGAEHQNLPVANRGRPWLR